MILAEGSTLADGRYTLVEHLGSGGMASVWRARDETLERDVAIKVMSDLFAGDERWLERFRREARAAASLQHANIVKVFDFGIEDGRPYLIMAYVAGGSLKEKLEAGARIDAAALARELLDALAHVHAAGIVHRDVKPANILLDAEGASHLTDFGIARPTDATAITQTGTVLGTRRYMAPEVAAGEPASERSDLYSAGCVIEEVAGEGSGLASLIATLTAEDPSERPAGAEAALRELRAPATAETVTTAAMGEDDTAPTAVLETRRAPRRDERAALGDQWRAARRSPWFAPAAALAAIVLLAIVVIALAAGGGDSGGRAPSVAPSNAPLSQQLDALDRAIDATR